MDAWLGQDGGVVGDFRALHRDLAMAVGRRAVPIDPGRDR
jgi:hypothetical protein